MSAPLTPEQLRQRISEFLDAHPEAAVVEDGRAIFLLAGSRYSITVEAGTVESGTVENAAATSPSQTGPQTGRCLLHLWSEERNMVRTVVDATERGGVLELTVQRFGRSKPQKLELCPDRSIRAPTARKASRAKFVRVLERVLLRSFPEFKATPLRSAADLEHSFGPAYIRGELHRGQSAWAVLAVSEGEQPATIEGSLTLGILWLAHCRERATRRHYEGLKLILPRKMAALNAARFPWLNHDAAKWELYELDELSEELVKIDASAGGNLKTHMTHAPGLPQALKRFAAEIARMKKLAPEAEARVVCSTEVSFSLHGLVLARARAGLVPDSFERRIELVFGTGPNETLLTEESETHFRELIAQVISSRNSDGVEKNPLYRMHPERWLESQVRKHVSVIADELENEPVYRQVPAFAAADRGMLDLLAVTRSGRLAVLELKASEDLQVALQGLDYWIRVRHHLLAKTKDLQNQDGQNEFSAHGYFPDKKLLSEAPLLYLVLPALHIHSATAIVLRYLSPEVPWMVVALDERWREQVRVVFRKRREDLLRPESKF